MLSIIYLFTVVAAIVCVSQLMLCRKGCKFSFLYLRDEEYDRGKRKKVKNGKESFDGANPFQDVASMKARKKMKLKVDQTRVGNQPLRIL